MTPFKIEVPQEVLNDLSVRLKQTRWTDEPENAGWNYGTNPGYLRELVDYWQNKYDWRTQETYLNQFPQFKTEIDGINVHFIYVKGKSEHAKPLILTHGWPDSFYRFHKVIPVLTDPGNNGGNADETFDLVIPSIPGFGFSDKVPQSSDQTARLWAKLMTEVLGYQTFYAAGGDIGSTITKSLANQYPLQVSAIHLTDVGYPNGREDWSAMSAPEQEFGRFIQQWFFAEGAFNLIQTTKPQTLGYSLNDSPVGLASWIIEKFHGWSGKPENLDNHYTKDELITNIMIYWITQTINTSIRTYAEEARVAWSAGLKSEIKVEVPTGVSLFPGEASFPIEWVNRKVNVQRFNVIEKGSHFAALNVPDLFAKELSDFFYSKF
ncbi:epoxide hydrolase family protein [Chitinophaga filiformis]|uniref:Epoxide hydrolase n=1 Tax=Chitinophaga filiformis TaxID=104663 RepID=A0ABY4I1H8_CHIFI|nr:epoxide hydrolase family protein [Chitinophaga filiformis]UPK69950.1 epoxide hydrolase [Chitinophaga filiformis]